MSWKIFWREAHGDQAKMELLCPDIRSGDHSAFVPIFTLIQDGGNIQRIVNKYIMRR